MHSIFVPNKIANVELILNPNESKSKLIYLMKKNASTVLKEYK